MLELAESRSSVLQNQGSTVGAGAPGTADEVEQLNGRSRLSASRLPSATTARSSLQIASRQYHGGPAGLRQGHWMLSPDSLSCIVRFVL